MKIDVQHIAQLAKLRLDEDKIEIFEQQMQDIVNMVENLPPIEADMGAPDKANAMLLREDIAGPSLDREILLANAPQKQAGCFVVPKTL